MRKSVGILGALVLAVGVGLFAPSAKAAVFVGVAPPVACNAYGCWDSPAPLVIAPVYGRHRIGVDYYRHPFWGRGFRHGWRR